MKKVALFLILLFVLLLSSCFVWSKDKPSVKSDTSKTTWVKRSDKILELQQSASKIEVEEKRANDYLIELSKNKLVLQGQYSVWMQMPDSILIKKDSTLIK